jgi:hypothetical protein
MIATLDKKSILVWSSYRTGSTALCDYFSKLYGIKNLDEIFHCTNKPANYEKYKNINVVLKVMPDQVPEKYWQDLTSQYNIVGLTRKSITNQIASFYVCHMTGTWHFNRYSKTEEYLVDIDNEELENQCRYILKMNQLYKDLKPACDLELVYEDIIDDLQKTYFVVYKKPKNIEQIVDKINKFLEEYNG